MSVVLIETMDAKIAQRAGHDTFPFFAVFRSVHDVHNQVVAIRPGAVTDSRLPFVIGIPVHDVGFVDRQLSHMTRIHIDFIHVGKTKALVDFLDQDVIGICPPGIQDLEILPDAANAARAGRISE